MTIQELINELNKIEDKNKTIGIYKELKDGADTTVTNFEIINGFKTIFGYETDYLITERIELINGRL